MRQQLSQDELSNYINRDDLIFVYGYTPICATCVLAEQFLNIATEVVTCEVVKVDLNYQEPFIEAYQIKSVPVLMAFRDGVLLKSLYRFHSVTNVVQFLKNIDD